ncbi:MAG: cell division protein FtsQ/DivIB [Chloroflexota bacterium]
MRGVVYTDPAAVRAALDLPDGLGMNIFRIRTAELEARIARLPSVRSARVRAWLPDRLEIDVVERAAILAWATDAGVWLVDGDGRLFTPAAAIEGDAPPPLPIVRDRRTVATGGTGTVLAAEDLAVARALAGLAPAEVGSDARGLALSVDDGDGWVLEVPGAWHAVFGIYTPTVRPVALLPAQVQCLAGIVGAREASLERIVLAPGPEGCGTFVGGPPARPTARPGARGG